MDLQASPKPTQIVNTVRNSNVNGYLMVQFIFKRLYLKVVGSQRLTSMLTVTFGPSPFPLYIHVSDKTSAV